MTDTANTGGRYTVTAFFHSRTDAEDAVESLIDEGFSRDSVRLVPGNERDPSDAPPEPADSVSGFFGMLGDMFLPDSDRHTYAEGLRRGGYLVSVSTTASNHDRALDILDDEGTIDMDEQETAWRAEGWTGATAGGMTGTGSPSARRMTSETPSRVRSYLLDDDLRSDTEVEIDQARRDPLGGSGTFGRR